MAEDFLTILNRWERSEGDQYIFDHLDTLLPGFRFRRVTSGGRDYWASPLKADLTQPRHPNREKTIVGRDMQIREQGEFDNPEWVLSRLVKEMGLANPYEVYKYLDSLHFLGMPKANSTEVVQQMKILSSKQEVLIALRDYFKWNLWERTSPDEKIRKVKSYLLKKRGFTEEQARDLDFGYVPSWDMVEKYITQTRHFRKEVLDSVCSVRGREGKTSVGNHHILAIPYVCGGVLKGFMFRRVDSSEPPKYLANANLDRKSVFFNIPESTEDLVVVEGELDALIATAKGLPCVAAIGGSDISSDRRAQVDDAFRRGVTRFFLCPDLDKVTLEDGTDVPNHAKRYKAVMRSVHTIKDVNMEFDNIYVVMLPYPTDPDEFIREQGLGSFVQLLRDALPYWKYVAEHQKDANE